MLVFLALLVTDGAQAKTLALGRVVFVSSLLLLLLLLQGFRFVYVGVAPFRCLLRLSLPWFSVLERVVGIGEAERFACVHGLNIVS